MGSDRRAGGEGGPGIWGIWQAQRAARDAAAAAASLAQPAVQAPVQNTAPNHSLMAIHRGQGSAQTASAGVSSSAAQSPDAAVSLRSATESLLGRVTGVSDEAESHRDSVHHSLSSTAQSSALSTAQASASSALPDTRTPNQIAIDEAIARAHANARRRMQEDALVAAGVFPPKKGPAGGVGGR